MTDVSKSNVNKAKQFRNLAILAGVVLLGFFGLIYMVSEDAPNKNTTTNLKGDFANPLEHVDAESVILERTQKQLKDADKKSEHLQEQIDLLINEKKTEASLNQNADELEKRIDALEQQMHAPTGQEISSHSIPGVAPMAGSDEFRGNLLPQAAGLPNDSNCYNGDPPIGQGIREDNLALTPSNAEVENRVPLKNPDTYVPAGTFVKAVMIGGADASAAVNAQSNPSPMLFRIVERGTLPNHKKSHLKDCVVTAAVVGDISSERGLIRLENLSCTFPNKEIVDQSVEGTIFGPEGKNGVRGRPVWREGALLQRAFAAGALSGISDGLSQIYTTNSISPQGNVQTIDPSKVGQVGIGKGVGKAMDKLAEYNIQRAEQYHPVIQLGAGTVVDVVFLKGFFLDGKKHENQDSSVGNYSISTTKETPTLFSLTNEESQTLPLSPDAVKRIQEHSKELGLRVTTQQAGT